MRNVYLRRAHAVTVLLALVVLGCGGGGGAGGADVTPAPTLFDLAIGSRAPSNAVHVYYDVLAKPPGAGPDVVLDGPSSGIRHARGLEIADGRLFVANRDDSGVNSTITIYDGFQTLVDGQAPSVTLDQANSQIFGPVDVEVHGGDLYVAQTFGDGAVLVFRDHATLVDGDAPDVVLDKASSGIAKPFSIYVDAQALFVANGQTGAGSVTVYDDPASIVSFQAPDVTLDTANSIVDRPRVISIWDDVLYVCCFAPGRVMAFSGAHGLVDGQAPDYVLGGPSSLQQPKGAVVVGGRLFVGDRGLYSLTDNGLAVFDDPDSLFSGAPPSHLISAAPVEHLHNLELAGGILWGITGDSGTVFAFTQPSTVREGSLPDISLFDPRMGRPVSLAVVERDEEE